MILHAKLFAKTTKEEVMQVEYRFIEIDKESEQIRTGVINQIVCKVIKRELCQPALEEQMSDKIFTTHHQKPNTQYPSPK